MQQREATRTTGPTGGGWARRLRGAADPEVVAVAAGPLLTSLGVAAVALQHGFRQPLAEHWVWWSVQALVFLTFILAVFQLREERSGGSRVAVVGLSGLGLICLAIEATPAFEGWAYAAHAAMLLLFCGEAWRLNARLATRLRNPSLLFPGSFLVLIIVGSLLISLPVARQPEQTLSPLDAAFTMTSAVCVTGLVVKNTAAEFTPVGQMIIALFIQLGGLGVIIFGSMLALLLGRRMSSHDTLTLSEALDDLPAHRVSSFVRFIVISTLCIELVGAALMLGLWRGDDLSFERRLGLSAFHSISAFCNAGFDITGQSMESYRHSALTHAVIGPLIVLGGLGFPVVHELATRWRRKDKETLLPALARPRRLSLHARLVLATSLVLYLSGVVLIFLSQWTSGASAPLLTHLADAHFMSITARTAGFNSLPMADLGAGSRFALMCLMLVGGSPGATAGGVKTVTLAVLVLSVVATIRQREETEAFARAIPDAIVRKAAAIAVCMLGLIGLATMVLSMTENARFEVALFECISAATTTGLSLGLTGELTGAGKVVIIVTMFLGRVGPLTLFAMLLRRSAVQRYQYARENVTLG